MGDYTLTAPDPNAPKRDGKRQDGCRQDRLPIVAFDRTQASVSGQVSGPLRACGAKSEGMNDGKADAQCVAFQLTGDRDAPGVSTYDDIYPTVSANPMSDRKPAIAFAERSRGDGRNFESQEELAYALANPASGGTRHSRRIAGTFGVRRLTPTECERLQGFPQTGGGILIGLCLDHQGNYVHVEMKSLRSQRPAGNVEKTGLSESAKIVRPNSSTSDLPTDEPAPRLVHISCVERTVEIHSQGKLYLSASIAEEKNSSPLPMATADFALLSAGLVSTAERIMRDGAAESQANGLSLIHLPNGNILVKLSGSEMTQLVKDVEIDLTTHKRLLKSITSSPSSTKNTERDLITSCFYVLNAIIGYILPKTEKVSSFEIMITTQQGWTAVGNMADSPRYRMLGNAVAVPCAYWIAKRIAEVENGND